MLDLDVAGYATVTADGIEIEKAARGRSPSRRCPRTTSGSTRSSAGTRSSRRTTPRSGSTGCSSSSRRASCSRSRSTSASRRPARRSGASSSSPRRARAPRSSRSTRRRRWTEAYSNAVTELFVEPAAKLEYVSLRNLSHETWHFAKHHARLERNAELDWVAGGFGSKRGKTRIQNDLNGRGATSRVTGAYFTDGTQHLDYDTFQEHIAPDCESDSPSRARCATRRRRSGAG